MSRKLRGALITYSEDDGRTIKREDVTVMFCWGEAHPRDRVITIDLPRSDKVARTEQCIVIGPKTLEKAIGCRIKMLKPRR